MQNEKLFPSLNDYRILVLSPHLDDAVFSAAELIRTCAPEVWTVFAGIPAKNVVTAWDQHAGFSTGEEQMRARREEDLRAFDGHHGIVKHLDFLERAYVSPSQRTEDMTALVRRIQVWLEESPQPAVIFLPAGAGIYMPAPLWKRLNRKPLLDAWSGNQAVAATSPERANPLDDVAQDEVSTTAVAPDPSTLKKRLKEQAVAHARRFLHKVQTTRRAFYQRQGMLANEDHLILRDVVLQNFKNIPQVHLGFYEELPYSWSKKADQQIQKNAPNTTKYEIPIDRDSKYARLKNYVSQIELMDPEYLRLNQLETLPLTETYWISKANA